MKLSKAIVALGFLVGIFSASSTALACGSVCEYGGLYSATGYTGYDLGTAMYDISSYTTTSTTTYVDYGGYSGGCGSYMGTCGNSSPSVCGGGCGGSDGGYSNDPWSMTNGGQNPYGGMVDPYNPMSNPMNPMSNPYADPYTQMMMGSTIGNPYMMPPGMDPIMSMMGPQSFPPIGYPPMMTNPYPGYYPTIPNVSFLPSSTYPYSYNPTAPFIPTSPTTTTYQNPTTNYGPIIPATNYPGTNPSITPIVSQPPTNPLPWGGCDNVVVMCPTGPTIRPPTVTTTPIVPLVPPITASPQYQTTPTDPNRQQIPRGIVTTHGVR